MEEQLPAGLGEGQVAEFVEDDEVAAYELICGAALASGAELGLEVVDQVDDVVVKRLSILTPDRRAKLTPLSGTAEVVPVVNRGGTC